MCFSNIKQNQKSSLINRGFTLFEVMVSLAIITIIASISFSGINDITDYLALNDATKELDGLVRKAQSSAINIQSSNGSSFGGRFGVAIDKDESRIVFYSDNDSNDEYNEGSFINCVGECINFLNFNRGLYVSNIKITDANNFERDDIGYVEILYKRPRPEAYFLNTDYENEDIIKEVEITLSSPSGRSQTILIGATGYISS